MRSSIPTHDAKRGRGLVRALVRVGKKVASELQGRKVTCKSCRMAALEPKGSRSPGVRANIARIWVVPRILLIRPVAEVSAAGFFCSP